MPPARDRTKPPPKPLPRTVRVDIVAMLLFVPFIAIAVLWIDQPLASLVFDRKSAQLTDQFLNTVSPLLVHGIPDLGLIAVLIVLARRAAEKRARLFFASLTVGLGAYAATEFILKPIFGRMDPHDWVWNHRAAFHFFSAVGGSYSFPSGHATLATGALATLSLRQKPNSALPLVLIAAFDLVLVALNIHFLGDVLAGTLFGYAIARLATAV